MLPKIWGRHAWNFIHLVTLEYPVYPTEEDKRNYYQFFHSLQYVLPCEKCRINFATHLQKYPLDDYVLSSRDNLVKWAIDLHNEVNRQLGKTAYNYIEAMNQIDRLSHPNRSWNLWILLIILVIIVILYFLYRCYSKN